MPAPNGNDISQLMKEIQEQVSFIGVNPISSSWVYLSWFAIESHDKRLLMKDTEQNILHLKFMPAFF